MSHAALEERCRALIAELALGTEADILTVSPLAGGVASDIAIVDLGDRKICIKFALPKLKVAADWRAPVHRNAAEYAWLQVAAEINPESAVRLFGRSAADHGFAMEYLEGSEVYLWKDHLLAEAEDKGEAAKVADLLGRMHAASTQTQFDARPFRNRDDFRALRIEPYLSHTRSAYPGLSAAIEPIEHALYERDDVLVHGDTSPKNILFRSGAPIILDAECATMGDANFDTAFCLNHLMLKAVHLPRSRDRLLTDAGRFWSSYARHVTWEDVALLEHRVAELLPILMLARVDGKSPVEYLGAEEQQTVRRLAVPLIEEPARNVSEIADRIGRKLRRDRA